MIMTRRTFLLRTMPGTTALHSSAGARLLRCGGSHIANSGYGTVRTELPAAYCGEVSKRSNPRRSCLQIRQTEVRRRGKDPGAAFAEHV